MMRARTVLLWLVSAVVIAVLMLVLVPRLRGPAQLPGPAYWPTQGWRATTPEDQGIDSARLADALLAMRRQKVDIHSLLLIRNGLVVVDATFYPYDGTTVHDVASVTKSVMTTLIGIAADQGKLRLDQPMLSFFADRPIANRDARKERVTVRHLASMSSGLECTSERDEATLKEMQASKDWVQFVLDRKAMLEPGTRFVYCSPGSHLLSAILQRATSMTALEFARENLFAPLGTTDVIWPSDPQGITRGWGDIRLHPRDMAKIGLLWLHQGVWEGKQIVSRTWVADSVKPQISVDEDDDYGYGWWIARDSGVGGEFRADGRGGQYIIVVPSANIILVTTGGGFSSAEIGPLLLPALVDMSRPLPANAAGVARLEAVVRTIAQAPKPSPVASLPATARAIAGKTFAFERNPSGLEAARLDFDGSAEAVLHVTLTGRREVHRWPVGLDGVYRMSRGDYGAPQGLRGYWADAQTFVFEYDGIANNDHLHFRFRFDGDRVVVDVRETAHELGARFEGRLKNR